MQFNAKNNKPILIRQLIPTDGDRLYQYLLQLLPETKQRFGPHLYDKNSINAFHTIEAHTAYIALELETGTVIAYSILKKGFLDHDHPRLVSYGLLPDHATDCTFAPSVADAWQSQGVGNAMFQYILPLVQAEGYRRVLLWGGVQADNFKALNFYQMLGFRTLGSFTYQGENYDLVLDI